MRHATQRMEERKISESEIIRILNNLDLRYPSYGKQVAEGVLGSMRLLRIVYVDTVAEYATDARIISAIDVEEGATDAF